MSAIAMFAGQQQRRQRDYVVILEPECWATNDQGYGIINVTDVLKPSGGRTLRTSMCRLGVSTGELWNRTRQPHGGKHCGS